MSHIYVVAPSHHEGKVALENYMRQPLTKHNRKHVSFLSTSNDVKHIRGRRWTTGDQVLLVAMPKKIYAAVQIEQGLHSIGWPGQHRKISDI